MQSSTVIYDTTDQVVENIEEHKIRNEDISALQREYQELCRQNQMLNTKLAERENTTNHAVKQVDSDHTKKELYGSLINKEHFDKKAAAQLFGGALYEATKGKRYDSRGREIIGKGGVYDSHVGGSNLMSSMAGGQYVSGGRTVYGDTTVSGGTRVYGGQTTVLDGTRVTGGTTVSGNLVSGATRITSEPGIRRN